MNRRSFLWTIGVIIAGIKCGVLGVIGQVRKIPVAICKIPVAVRTLKATWSFESAQDICNMDADGTLSDRMADEIIAEIDREIARG